MKFLSTTNFLEGWRIYRSCKSSAAWTPCLPAGVVEGHRSAFASTVNQGTLSGPLKYYQHSTLPESSTCSAWEPLSHLERQRFIVCITETAEKKIFLIDRLAPLTASSSPFTQQVLKFNCIITEMNGSVHNSQRQTSANTTALRLILKQTLFYSHEGQM